VTNLVDMPPARRIFLPGGGWLNVHEQAGVGPPLLLLHGFTDCAHSYRLILPYLKGRHVVIPDLRGHGQSFRTAISGLDDFCSDLEAMATELSLEPATVVGHSMGALIAVHLTARGSLPVTTLITLSGSLAPASAALAKVTAQFAFLPHPLPMDHPFLDDWHACRHPVPEAFLQPLRRSCVDMRPEDWDSCLGILRTADLQEEAGRVAVASLVIGGDADPLFPESHQIALASALPNAHRQNLPGVGHNPHWEVAGDVANMLLQFEAAVQQARKGHEADAFIAGHRECGIGA
jgi:pimeloyl-ACP methyl ester carboxylesterase